MQRHSGGKSRFMAIHEPFRTEPWISSVEKDGDVLVVRYMLGDSLVEDRIRPDGGKVSVSSSAGWNYQSGQKH